MKKIWILFLVCFLTTINVNAQFIDDMESYTDGEPINEWHWTDGGCGGGEGCSILSSSAFAVEGDLSGFIPGDGTTEAALDLGNKIFGQWGLVFWIYIPEGKEGEISLQGTVPIEEGNSVVGGIFFNKDIESPGVGLVTDSALGEVLFDFPHNEWFRVVMNWDINSGISLSTWQFFVNDENVIPTGTPYTNQAGEYPTSLGGILFSSASSNNSMFLDYFCYVDSGGGCTLDIEDHTTTTFNLFPNPSKEFLNIQSNDIVKNVKIYNIIGNEVINVSETNSINILALSKGMYFVVVETDKGIGVQKLIKD